MHYIKLTGAALSLGLMWIALLEQLIYYEVFFGALFIGFLMEGANNE